MCNWLADCLECNLCVKICDCNCDGSREAPDRSFQKNIVQPTNK
jgi:hypothetical protein